MFWNVRKLRIFVEISKFFYMGVSTYLFLELGVIDFWRQKWCCYCILHINTKEGSFLHMFKNTFFNSTYDCLNQLFFSCSYNITRKWEILLRISENNDKSHINIIYHWEFLITLMKTWKKKVIDHLAIGIWVIIFQDKNMLLSSQSHHGRRKHPKRDREFFKCHSFDMNYIHVCYFTIVCLHTWVFKCFF